MMIDWFTSSGRKVRVTIKTYKNYWQYSRWDLSAEKNNLINSEQVKEPRIISRIAVSVMAYTCGLSFALRLYASIYSFPYKGTFLNGLIATNTGPAFVCKAHSHKITTFKNINISKEMWKVKLSKS